MKSARWRGVAIGLAVLMGAYVAANLRIGTNVTHFMPDGSDSDLAVLSGRLADSELTRTLVLAIGSDDPAHAREAARALAGRLEGDPELAWVRTGVEGESLGSLYELYFPRRHYFVSDDPERELPQWLGEPALRDRARELRNQLALPTSTLLENVASADPIGAFGRILERAEAIRPPIRIEAGQFVSQDGAFAIVLLSTRASAFDSGRVAPLLERIDAAFDEVAASQTPAGAGDPAPRLWLEMGGAHRFAVAAESDIKRDVYRVGALSFTGIAVLFFAFVGSLRSFGLVVLAPLAGILVATSAGLAVFGDLDGLTMAFGTSLMGVAVDYSIHLLVHNGLSSSPEIPFATQRRLRPTLVLGAATTMASFAGLLFTSLPALRQMGFYAIAGIAGALALTLFVLPGLLPYAPPIPARSQALARRLGAGVEALQRHRRWLLALPVALVLLAPLALPRLTWIDDLSRLTVFDPALRAEDQRVRERISQLDASRFVVGIAPDPASALQLDERIHARLRAAVEAGQLAGMRSLHALLWSEELQLRNAAQLQADPELYERVQRAFAAEGFRRGAFEPFRDALASPLPPPLRPADLEGTLLAPLLASHLLELGDTSAVVTYLRGVEEPDAIAARLADLEGVYLLDQRSFVSDIYRSFRRTTLLQIGVGSLLVVAILFARYRRWRETLAAFLPSALVALLLLELFALTGTGLNLFHVMSMVMVMGMGVDYGIFIVDSAREPDSFGATMLSLLLSCLTTVFVFGSLAVSSQPSLRAIGVTTGLGILLSFALAPIALVICGRSASERASA